MLQVCVECGIKDSGIASEAVVDLCLKSWEDLFQGKMSVSELRLAFEMNVNGELEMMIGGNLEPRVNHYQCFSREFFCEVCRRYLIKKTEANVRVAPVTFEQAKALPLPDTEILLMEAIIHDRQHLNELTPYPVIKKLDMLSQMFEFDINEKQIEKYRKVSIGKLITDTANARAAARVNKKFGAEIEAANKVERLKHGPLSNKDEAEIQFEVNTLIYGNALMLWTEAEFVKHVEDCIKQLKGDAP